MEPATFHCDLCHREFKTRKALVEHTGSHHDGPPDERNLTQEEKEFLSKSTLETLRDFRDSVAPLTIRIKRLPHGEGLPNLSLATPGSAAFDLYAALDASRCLGTNERATPPIPTGLAIEIPEGYCALVIPRSGLANNSGISIINAPGLIDSDYRGEIKVGLVNHSRVKHWVHRGERIGQLFVMRSLPIEFQYVDELSQTSRGTGGFGSTGV